jgi:hypothetical protein
MERDEGSRISMLCNVLTGNNGVTMKETVNKSVITERSKGAEGRNTAQRIKKKKKIKY